MNLKRVNTEGLLECTRCGNHFRSNQMTQILRRLYDTEITIKCCPYCGSYEVEPVREQRNLDKYRFLSTKNEDKHNKLN